MRVALLARPGPACEHLLAALRDASADVVLVADPTEAAPDDVTTAGAQAVLVALEPSIEDALERFDALLADPAMTVIFDEAELAAAREGWDAARWVRHLAAKLHRHDDVLPPGGEPEPEEIAIEAGAVQLYERPDSDGDLSAIANEAAGLADAVPRDGIEFVSAGEAAPQADAQADWSGPFDLPDPAPETASTDGEAPGVVDTNDDDADARARFLRDMDDLQQRIAHMELVDAPRTSAGKVGAVAILAGIGGPDAVRQLLGGLPERFPRPVLVQQRLDGARHDKLVRQMQRASKLPVELAEAGGTVQPGHVYVLPAGLGVAASESGLGFVEDGDDTVFANLPPDDSAVVLLSGSDSTVVEAAMSHAIRGALVLGQSPDGCYDATAAQALVARGAEAGGPVELARQLAARWPS